MKIYLLMIIVGIFGIIAGILSFIAALKKKNYICKNGPKIEGERQIFILFMAVIIFILGIILVINNIKFL